MFLMTLALLIQHRLRGLSVQTKRSPNSPGRIKQESSEMTKDDVVWHVKTLIVLFLIILGISIPKIEAVQEPSNFESLSIQYGGTGFIVSENYILTAGHVIDDCEKVTVRKGYKQIDSKIMAISSLTDLGLLKTKRSFEDVAKFRRQHISVGKTILKYGYSSEVPAGGWTKGSITSQWGVNSGGRRDLNLLQYDALTHRGNSGGPVLDQSGHVVGIVVSGAGPTLSNAVDTYAAGLFLSTNFVKYEEGHSTQDLDLHDVARQAKDFTVRVECWQ